MKPRYALCFLFVGIRLWAFASPGNEDRCLQCHGNRTPEPAPRPGIAEQFSMRWRMFEFTSEERPPFAKIPAPHSFINGRTYYDWSERKMTEIYREKCIDIFPAGREYACQFTSIRDKTYFIKFRDHDIQHPESCCLWRKTEFWAPRPDVLQNMEPDKKMDLDAKSASWWALTIPLPGPFGYGLFEASRTPAAFWFPVIRGWVQQNFSDFEPGKPDAKYFALPALCRGDIAECPET